MEVWSQWCPVAWPDSGWLISSFFAKRLQQLNLLLRPLDTAYGIDSQVKTVRDLEGSQVGAAWLRTLRSSGQTIYSGWYSTELLPGAVRPSIRKPSFHSQMEVLPSSCGQEVRSDGALVLSSPAGRFGSEGAYLVVARADRKSGWALRVPLAERFVVFVDDEGVLRTDQRTESEAGANPAAPLIDLSEQPQPPDCPIPPDCGALHVASSFHAAQVKLSPAWRFFPKIR